MIPPFGVARYDPLKIYVNYEGLVRFATELYSESVETLQSRTEDLDIYCNSKQIVLGRMMHLTNYSVNKQSVAYNPNVPSFIFYSLFSLLQEPSFRSELGRARRGGPWTRRWCGSAAP